MIMFVLFVFSCVVSSDVIRVQSVVFVLSLVFVVGESVCVCVCGSVCSCVCEFVCVYVCELVCGCVCESVCECVSFCDCEMLVL